MMRSSLQLHAEAQHAALYSCIREIFMDGSSSRVKFVNGSNLRTKFVAGRASSPVSLGVAGSKRDALHYRPRIKVGQ